MELKVVRKWKRPEYTIGQMFVNGQLYCNTLEDKDRGLKDSMSLQEIKKLKVQDKTAIPTGTYNITLNITSPKFGQKKFYQQVCNGKLPRLLDVKGYEGVLIHVGEGANGHKLTSGCILVGKNTIVGGLTKSKETFTSLYNEMRKATLKGEGIKITIE